MEEKQIGEQPTNDIQEQNDVLDAQQSEQIENQEQGSPYGKFKDAESLLCAYNNLQAEFTRKCQKLSELEKQENTSKEDIQPVFSKEDWQDKVLDFLNTHTEAKKFASEISSELISNPELSTKEDALELAWAKVIGQKYKPVDEIISDEKFVNDYILSSEQIKQKVLESYIKDISNAKLPPISTASSGGEIAFTKPIKATNLNEAKTLVEAIFNIKKEK